MPTEPSADASPASKPPHEESASQLFAKVSQSVRGPIPSAEQLAKYKGIDPDIVPWILERARDEQALRHEAHLHAMRLNEKALQANIRMGFLGYSLIAFLVLCTLVLAIIHPSAATIAAAVGPAAIGAIATMYQQGLFNRSRDDKPERTEKDS